MNCAQASSHRLIRGQISGGAFLTGMALTLAVVLHAPALQAEEEIRNWPCEAPLADHFVPEDVWGGPLPQPLAENWRDDAEVRDVVEFAANPENPASQGERKIVAFAEGLDADREARLMGVYAGLLAEFDLLRSFVVDGIRDFVLRAKILNEAVEKNDAILASLPADGSAATAEQRKGYQQARFWDARNLDDALDEAEFLCHRYGYLERKLRTLTAALRAAL